MILSRTHRSVLRALISYCDEMRRAPEPHNKARPKDLGGSDGSVHSRVLRDLVDLGLAEKHERNGYNGHHRPSYRYAPTPLGRQLLPKPRRQRQRRSP